MKIILVRTSLAAVKRMMTVFDSETINRVESMLKLIDAENWLELGKEAHTLKSSAASYGAIRLSKLAEIIERDVLESDSNAIAIDAANYSELSTLSIESIAQLKTILEQQNA
jgi:HPt (histidine-containing phosphotransfer) domain-containing protein